MSSTSTLRALAEKHYPEASLLHGWCYDGAGEARYGWFLRYASGKQSFLARTARDAQWVVFYRFNSTD